jgi:hypothetical protein
MLPFTKIMLPVVPVMSYVRRHVFETTKQLFFGISKQYPQRVPLVAPCPATNVRVQSIKIVYTSGVKI